MFRRAKTICCGALLAFASTIAPAMAGGPSDIRLFVSSAASGQPVPFLTFGGPEVSGANGRLDFALFATELLAYVTKEVMSDSGEEYRRSPLGSRWSPSMPKSSSEFGSHCLMIVGRIGSVVPEMMPSAVLESTPSVATYAVGAATTGLALRQIWRAFERDIRDDRGGVSLDPKVSTRRVGVNLTLHW